MNRLINLVTRLYYEYWNIIPLGAKLNLPSELNNKKNLSIYFDYEREFGGHATNINDNNICELLDILDEYKIKTTWFTVGKIFEQYPNSIKNIIARGHEIGSHTYSHIVPFHTPRTKLILDFDKFNNISAGHYSVKGFHAPKGRWSLMSIRLLKKYKFQYELLYAKKNSKPDIRLISAFGKRPILRFKTIGDDWKLYNYSVNHDKSLNHFLTIYNRLNKGYIAAIGFHPWILYSNDFILSGFKSFLERISNDKNININTLDSYARFIQKTYKI